MNSENATGPGAPSLAPREAWFTVEQANRALVLIRRIVTDIVERHTRLLELRAERRELSNQLAPQQRLRSAQADIDGLVDELHRLHNELSSTGCLLKDWSAGLVDFPARYQGRKVWLCWRLGEPTVGHWHELGGGFAGRQPIRPDFA